MKEGYFVGFTPDAGETGADRPVAFGDGADARPRVRVPLAARAAGRAAPLTFLVAGGTVFLVALSFVAFSRRIASAGSAYAFVGSTFGGGSGFLTGWTLLLVYLGGCAASAALFGSFLATALKGLGPQRLSGNLVLQ